MNDSRRVCTSFGCVTNRAQSRIAEHRPGCGPRPRGELGEEKEGEGVARVPRFHIWSHQDELEGPQALLCMIGSLESPHICPYKAAQTC